MSNKVNPYKKKKNTKPKAKDIFTTLFVGSIFFALALFCFFKPNDDFSYSERRALSKFPKISSQSVLSGKAMSDFESYTLDQFPMRDSFRTLKALISKNVFLQKENNGLYYVDNHIASLDYPLDESSVIRAASRFEYAVKKYADEANRVYLSLIPDKNYFLAEKNGYPSMDYDKLVSLLRENCPSMQYIDIFPTLTIDDYYNTDTHWKQENIIDTASFLANALGTNIPDSESNYGVYTLEDDFSGVYAGQIMLPTKKDRISYLRNDVIDSFVVQDHENGKMIETYTLEKASGKDPYEIFLNGPVSLVEIYNGEINKQSTLVIFRDSFTSSLAPLLAQGYQKTILVDIRYMNIDFVGSFVDFKNADILFLYSTSVINNSETIK